MMPELQREMNIEDPSDLRCGHITQNAKFTLIDLRDTKYGLKETKETLEDGRGYRSQIELFLYRSYKAEDANGEDIMNMLIILIALDAFLCCMQIVLGTDIQLYRSTWPSQSLVQVKCL